MSIPLKFRFSTPEVPTQLNSNLNRALYLGLRTDQYKLHYHTPPLGKAERHITHLGFSAGIFTVLGSTAVTPTTTYQRVDLEYDGLIWSKKIAGIVAIDNFAAGPAIGVDNLLDHNRKFWVYQYKPWIGVAFGLNLN